MHKVVFIVFILLIVLSSKIGASPYGQGVYGENVPYGGATSISMTTSGTVNIAITPVPGGATNTGDDTVTVTTTDVNGYILNIKNTDNNQNITNGLNTVGPTSGTYASPSALDNNSWGYRIASFAPNTYAAVKTNLSGGENIKTTTGPDTGGDVTTVTFGAKIDNTKTAGIYSDTILYTATGQTP